METKKVKAIGLLSGGLDSIIAAKVIQDLGIDVYGLLFYMPWGCGDKGMATKGCEKIDIPLKVIQLEDDFMDVIINPKHGYGTAINPCMDCKIHMIKKAAEYMKEINADFVFTGEVIGQRPMSQLKQKLLLIEKKTGLNGNLLRPLCAKLLEPTIPELNGKVDRNKLFAFSGRSRKQQLALAKQLNITEFNQPAGGCLLTDKNFESRLKDAFKHGNRSFDDTVLLKWGRHFRINDKFKVILGRDENENNNLMKNSREADLLIDFQEDVAGPIAILQGDNPPNDIISLAGGLIQRFSKFRNDPPKNIIFSNTQTKNQPRSILATKINDDQLNAMKL